MSVLTNTTPINKDKQKVVQQGPSKLNRSLKDQLTKAAEALIQFESNLPMDNSKLIEDEVLYSVEFHLSKVPENRTRSPIYLQLPNPVIESSTPVGLIVGGPKERELAEVLISKGNLSSVKQIYTLREIQKNYSTPELRRVLLNSYTRFYCESKLLTLLPSKLGKDFFLKKRLPYPIRNLKDLEYYVSDRLPKTTQLVLNSGLMFTVKVGHGKGLSGGDGLVENALACVDQVTNKLGYGNSLKGWNRLVYIKLRSNFCKVSLPVYVKVNFEKSPIKKKVIDEVNVKVDDEVNVKVDAATATADDEANVIEKVKIVKGTKPSATTKNKIKKSKRN